MSAIQVAGDLQDYYARKLKEGKPKMLIINAARNKLIHRVCAVVKNIRAAGWTKIIRQPLLNL